MSQVERNATLRPTGIGRRLSLMDADGGVAPDITVSVLAGAVPSPAPVGQSPLTDQPAANFSGFHVHQAPRTDDVFFNSHHGRPPAAPFEMPALSACAGNGQLRARSMSTGTDLGERGLDGDNGSRRPNSGSLSGLSPNSASAAARHLPNQKHKKTEHQVAMLKRYFEMDDKPSR